MTRYRSYHAMRARVERALAYSATHEVAADAHLRLSALHLSRALILDEVDRRLGTAADGKDSASESLSFPKKETIR